MEKVYATVLLQDGRRVGTCMSNGEWLRLPDSGHCPSKGDQEEWG